MPRTRKYARGIATFLLGLVAVGIAVHYRSLDGLGGNLLGVLFRPDTEYTAGYTDAAFRKVRERLSKEQVLDLLGFPFYTNEDWSNPGPEERWWYSRSPGSTHYRMREVRFRDDHVSQTVHYFYVD